MGGEGQAMPEGNKKTELWNATWPEDPPHTRTYTPNRVWEKRFQLLSFLSQRKTTLNQYGVHMRNPPMGLTKVIDDWLTYVSTSVEFNIRVTDASLISTGYQNVVNNNRIQNYTYLYDTWPISSWFQSLNHEL